MIHCSSLFWILVGLHVLMIAAVCFVAGARTWTKLSRRRPSRTLDGYRPAQGARPGNPPRSM